MANSTVSCSKCAAPLPYMALTTPGGYTCATCGVSLQGYVFPALLRPQSAGEPGDTVVIDGSAGCFYHPHRQAVVPCAQCGRFLCSLCDVELHGQHLCLTCVNTSNSNGVLSSLANRRRLYDSIALRLAILPALLVWPTLISAPMTIFYTLRHWRSPLSILPRTKIRFVVALVLAVLQILAWIYWIFFTWQWTWV